MTVELTEEEEAFIAEQVRSGHYRTANEVVAKSLAMLRAQEDFIRSNQADLRGKIGVGLEEMRRGEVTEGREAIQRLRKNLRDRNRSR